MTQSQTAEYNIYTFDCSDCQDMSGCSWSLNSTFEGKKEALTQARRLFKTEKYARIEIKTQYYDQRLQKRMDRQLMVFDKNRSLFRTLKAFFTI